MLKIEHLEVWGFEHAIRGMRNPMNSWEKSDSQYEYENVRDSCGSYIVGANDLGLMRKLYSAGTEHRKFMRQIMISLDITAPLYWWKEFDTYKVGTVANSTSTMHKIHAKEFTLDDFSHEHLGPDSMSVLQFAIDHLNRSRSAFIEASIHCVHGVSSNYTDPVAKDYWWQMIQLLPSSYNQKRTITMNYENAAAITHQRHNHKQDEWRYLIGLLIEQLPYFADIIGKEKA